MCRHTLQYNSARHCKLLELLAPSTVSQFKVVVNYGTATSTVTPDRKGIQNFNSPKFKGSLLISEIIQEAFDADRTRLAPPRSSALGGREKPAEGEGSLEGRGSKGA